MEQNLTQRELAKWALIVALFAGILAGLKIYDDKTSQIGKIGQNIFSRFLGK